MDISGGCLCDAVRYRAAVEAVFSLKCYCTDCRKTSGAGYAGHIGFPKSAVTTTGPVTNYVRKADSGNEVTRAFCPTCGAGVYALLSAVPDLIFLRASTLDDVSLFKPQLAVFASRAPHWDPVGEGLPAYATAPPDNG
jgi:hypothetical protein